MTHQFKSEHRFPISIGFHVDDDEEVFSTYLFLFLEPEEVEDGYEEIIDWVFSNNLQDACLTEEGVARELLKNAELTWHSDEEYDDFTFQGCTYTHHMPDGYSGVRLSRRQSGEPFEVSSIGPHRVMVLDHSRLPVQEGV